MKKLNLNTNKIVRPVIYCFTTPNDRSHDGYCKIGYTERMTAKKCIYNESRRTDTECKLEWESLAIFDNGNYEPFTDHDFHKYLEIIGIERKDSVYKNKRKPEYFKITPEEAQFYLDKFKKMKMPDDAKRSYELRKEQQSAVDLMKNYMEASKKEKKEFLLNAKPRFGKTLTVYDYCKKINAEKILIVTNRPVIATSWYDDYLKFLGTDEYIFISHCDSVKEKEYCYNRKEYLEKIRKSNDNKFYKIVQFVSLQDLKGSKWFGKENGKDKLKDVHDMIWDVLIVDESHEGVDTFKTEIVFNIIKKKETIFLSGTPFKQIANEKFSKDAIFNWTYAQEQEQKEIWNYEEDNINPYEELPKLNLFTYRLNDMFIDEDRLNESNEREKFFNLNAFFETNDSGKFINEKDVDIFLNTITSIEKYPLANEETKSQINHSLWLMNRVNSAKAMAKKLKLHPAFKDYEIVLAAGDGKLDDDEKIDEDFNKVVSAIKKYNKTITLSVGKLTTGVTIPEWSAVFMLCNVESPSLYIQASFRAQNPCKINNGDGTFKCKENAYVFDFDPARSLNIIDKFANDLYSDTASGRGDINQRSSNIEKLVKYFPIIGEDENGELINYQPEEIITIPSKIQAKEIVRHGFMCNFLFQNIGSLFNDSKAMDILKEVKEMKTTHSMPENIEPKYDENGNVKTNEEELEKKTDTILAEIELNIPKKDREDAALKLCDSLNQPESFLETLKKMKTTPSKEDLSKSNELVDEFIKERTNKIKDVITDTIDKEYPKNILNKEKIKKDIVNQFTEKIKKVKIEHDIEMEELRVEYEEQLKTLTDASEIKKLTKEYKYKKEEKEFDFACQVEAIENEFGQEFVKKEVKQIETKKQEKENKKAENDFAFPKLKAFARSIPSFLMAFGDETTTCRDLAKIISPKVFKEMTGIELSDYEYFIERNYFNEIAFNNAIKEFFILRKKLANYFDENNNEDIFDYIPPQKTNQIFTPKKVVIEMADLLEENNPGCFDDPNHTFIDLYMKSGLYIAEIVKRLYRSKKLQKLYPDRNDRLKHIFEYQVYGLAPTEIIYNIAKNFVLGFDETINIENHNLKLLDAQKYAQEGTLEKKLDEIFAK